MIGPELAKDAIDLHLQQAFPGRNCPDHLGKKQPATAFASRPLDDPAFPPEGAESSHLFHGGVPIGVDHGPIVGTIARRPARVD